MRAAPAPPGFVVDTPFPGVTFDLPLQVVFLPDGRKLVAEKDGAIRVVSAEGEKLPVPFVDLRAQVLSSGDRGLMGFALDPDFAINGWVYLTYTVDPDSNLDDSETSTYARVERYRARASDPNVIDLESRQVLIGTGWADGIPCPGTQRAHVVGTLRFGRDKTLLIGTGDAANFQSADRGGQYPEAFGPGRFDPSEDVGAFRAQNINSMGGKILRVDKETGHGLPSNPFWDGDPAAARSRVWLYGLRNPFRFGIKPGSGSQDPDDGSPGTLYVADVGWTAWEELHVCARSGLNLGWPCIEGPAEVIFYAQGPQPAGFGCNSFGTATNPSSPTAPDAWWSHTDPSSSSPPGAIAASFIAGAYYTGASYPSSFRNSLFVADYINRWIGVIQLDANDRVLGFTPFIASEADLPVDLEIDPATGDVWFVSIATGSIRRIRFATGNRDPLAVASVTPNYGPAPLLTQFDASATVDADADPLSFLWRFGDGASDTAGVTSHVYSESGTYHASLAVRDGQGGRDSLSFLIVVGASPPPGKIALPPAGAFHDPGDLVQLQAVPVDTSLGSVTYRWDVDLLHFANPDHVHESQFVLFGRASQFQFDITGNVEATAYRVRLTVTQGALATVDTVVIHPRQDIVAAPLSLTPRSPRMGESVVVTASLRAVGGIGAFEASWRLRDGATTLMTGLQPPLAPGDSVVLSIPLPGLADGDRTLTLIADSDDRRTETNEGNNLSSIVAHVRGNGEPFASWSADSASGDSPLPPDDPGPWSDLVNGVLDATLVGYMAGEYSWYGSASPGDPAHLEMDGVSGYARLAAGGGAEELRGDPPAASAEIWFRPGSDVTRVQQLLHWADGPTEPRRGLSLQIAEGRLRVDARPMRDIAAAIPNVWTHVIVSAGPQSLRVFVNGQRMLTDTYANLGPQVTELRLGAASTAGSGAAADFFAGGVGEVRLYEDELDDARAAARFAARVAYYRGEVPPPRRLLALVADSAIGGAPAPTPGAASPWEDVSGNVGSLELSGFEPVSDTSGWQGDGSSLSPWRLEFDGVNDLVTLVPDGLAEVTGAESLTVALWIRTGSDVDRAQTLLDWRAGPGPGAAAFVLSLASGSFRFGVGGGQVLAPAQSDRWYHLVVSTARDVAWAWLDGEPVWTIHGPAGAAQHTWLALGGPAVGGAAERFRGAVSRLEVWQGVFSDAEMRSIHESQSKPYLHRMVAGGAAPTHISIAEPCASIPFRLLRGPGPTLRGLRVMVRLGPGLEPCGRARAGPAFDSTLVQILEMSPEPGLHQVDVVVFGGTCSPGDAELFMLPVSSTADSGASTLEIADVILRDCENQAMAVDLGDPLEVRVDRTPPVPPSGLTVTPEPDRAGVDGRHPMQISFSVAADVESVQVFRAPFGNAPEYDDPPGAGQLPASPLSYPPGPPWQPSSVTRTGRTDDPVPRDAWTYVAYAFDAAGNRSPVSPSSAEVVNYRLGDVRGSTTACASDGRVGAADLAGLSGVYGAVLAPEDARACLDVGPTQDGSVVGRPLTDDVLDFEDLMVVALDHDATASGPAPITGVDAIALAAEPSTAVGDTFDVEVFLRGTGRLHGLSARIQYDATRVAPVGVSTSYMLASQRLASVVLTPGGGVLDIALLGKGPGLHGTDRLAIMRFRRLAEGLLSFSFAEVRGRDALNQPVPVLLDFPIADAGTVRVDRVALSHGVPDPFRDRAEFQMSLPRAGPVRVTAFDLAGRRVRTLVDGPREAGVHRIAWDGRDEAGIRVAPGLYWLTLEADRVRRTRRVVRLR